MTLLILSLIIPILAPVCYFALQKIEYFVHIERFFFLIITGLLLTHILPESISQSGIAALLMFALGMFIPSFFEKMIRQFAVTIHTVPIIIGVIGLTLHGLIDGAALISDGVQGLTHKHILPLTVVLHRIPGSMFMWWLLYPRFGWKAPTLALVVTSLATIVGYSFATHALLHISDTYGVGLFEALVAGSLMHLAMHHNHDHDHA